MCVAKKINDYYWRSHSEVLRGMIINGLFRFNEAIDAYKNAVVYASLQNDSLQLGRAFSSLGFSFLYSEQYDSAMVYLLTANDILSDIPDSLKSLTADDKIGTMLTCNLIIQKNGGEVEVSSINPVAAMVEVNNEEYSPGNQRKTKAGSRDPVIPILRKKSLVRYYLWCRCRFF